VSSEIGHADWFRRQYRVINPWSFLNYKLRELGGCDQIMAAALIAAPAVRSTAAATVD